jgi:hypothetical protein
MYIFWVGLQSFQQFYLEHRYIRGRESCFVCAAYG